LAARLAGGRHLPLARTLYVEVARGLTFIDAHPLHPGHTLVAPRSSYN